MHSPGRSTHPNAVGYAPGAGPFYRPLIPLLLALMGGLAAGSHWPGLRLWSVGGLALALAATAWAAICSGRSRMAPLGLFFVLGYLSIQPWTAPRLPSGHVVHFADQQSYQICGTVRSVPRQSRHWIRFVMQVETVGLGGRGDSAAGRLRVTVGQPAPRVRIGDRVSLKAKIRSIRSFNNPGGFDYRRYMAYKGIWCSAYVPAHKLMVLERGATAGVQRRIQDARSRVAALIDASASERTRGVLRALLIGDRDHIADDLRDAFHRAGVGHLLAISGLHIGIVAAVTFGGLLRVLALWRPLLWSGRCRQAAALCAMFPVMAYALLAGMSPSTQRAVIMVGVFLAAFLVGRQQDPVNTLAVAALVILTVHPPALFSISFQLSFAAVFAILHGMSRRPLRMQRPPDRCRRIAAKLTGFVLVSLLAILGTLPLIMFYFNQVSTAGLTVNLFIVPVVSLVVVPLGLFSVLMVPASAWAAGLGLTLCSAVLEPTLDVVAFCAGLPFAAVKTVTPTVLEMICFYGLLWAALGALGRRGQGERGSPAADRCGTPVPSRPGAGPLVAFTTRCEAFIGRRWPIMVMLLAGAVLAADGLFWSYQRFWHRDLRVTVIDVGQGSAVLLELPGGECMLVDGGGFSDNTVFDIGARVVAPVLWRKKIRSVETLVLSHPNSDHLNGLIYIARHFNVRQIWSNGQPCDTVACREWLRTVRSRAISMPPFALLPRKVSINGVSLALLYPSRQAVERQQRDGWRDANNNSLVLKVTYGSISVLLTGDIMALAERELAGAAGGQLNSTCLLVPHHGSRTSSTDAFLGEVRPEVAFISAGRRYGRPFAHPTVLQRYRERGCRIFCTDTHGAVTLSTDGRSYRIRSALPAGCQ